MSASPPPTAELSRQAAIVGVGTSDFALDYRRGKEGSSVDHTNVDLAATAFERALEDAGIRASDVDGLGVCIAGADFGAVASQLGVTPDVDLGGTAITVIPQVVAALASGRCRTAAVVWGVTNRSSRRPFGGEAVTAANTKVSSYYYHHPWGWSSQAGHWAFMHQRYLELYGMDEEAFGRVAITVREHASRNENAIMRSPLTLDDYMAARFVIRPLRLFDICVVNDGGVCLILQRLDEARDRPHPPVSVAGWGRDAVKTNKFDDMVRHRLRPQMQRAGAQALDMARLTIADIDTFHGYDASTIHLINQVEGYGFAEPGEGLDFCADGHMGLTGSLPTNTSGGLLSEAYMMGWNHVVEVTRQLRHEAGPRQIAGVTTGMTSFTTTDSADPMIFTRED